MAFWGVEVKPGKPFTHAADNTKGRLHISQATLGIGAATNKSLVQCNVGSKSPVFLCSLFPDKAESCQLNLEFEEADEVVFSVIGPRSVHLTGYHLGGGRHYSIQAESESFGEDIAETETERSEHAEEDEYDDSFIDDGDPDVFLDSPVFNVFEETVDKSKPKKGKGSRRRLRKKYQLSESDDDNKCRHQTFTNRGITIEELDSENEDKLPISDLCKNTSSSKGAKLEAVKISVMETDEADNNENTSERKAKAVLEAEPERNANLQCTSPTSAEVGPKNVATPKKKKKERAKEEKSNVVKEDKAQQDVEKADNLCQDLRERNESPKNGTVPKKKRKERIKEEEGFEVDCVNHSGNSMRLEAKDDSQFKEVPERNELNEKQANYVESNLPHNSSSSSTQVDHENGAKLKRKRKEKVEDKSLNVANDFKDEAQQYLSVGDDQIQRQADDKNFDTDGDRLVDETRLGERKKKKKKRGKTQKDKNNVKMENPLLSIKEKSRSVMVVDGNNTDDKSSHLRTFSNRLIIEELETGKPDDKVAAPGKKVSIHYTGKLKENGQVFDSNVGNGPLKFRLGDKEVMEGWNVGLDGMRVGDKRRIIIPPSMGYGSKGVPGQNIPPDSWLEFDVKLVKVL